MVYCSDCGTEVENNVSYCPDCGSQINSSDNTNSEQVDTAPCQKCDSEISVEAMKCPNCQWEPSSSGVFGNIFAILCIPWIVIGLFLYAAFISAFFIGGYSIIVLVASLFFITLFISVPVTYLYGLSKNSDRKPTEKVEVFERFIQD